MSSNSRRDRSGREFRISHDIIQRTKASVEQEHDHSDDDVVLDDMKAYLRLLPEKEQDILEMYVMRKKRQKDIAAYFAVSQGAISHRISRARQRLKFIKNMPKIGDAVFRKAVLKALSPLDADISLTMVRTTCQSETAKILNKTQKLTGKETLTQIKVRHKFEKALDTVGKYLGYDKAAATYLLETGKRLVYKAPSQREQDTGAYTSGVLLTEAITPHKLFSLVRGSLGGKEDQDLVDAFGLMLYIYDGGLYMLHEVKLPHFDRGSRAEL